jgi:hypothetical protein
MDADTMFPILTWCMVWAEAPNMHACLFFLRHFSLAAEEAAGADTGEAGECREREQGCVCCEQCVCR